MSARVVSTVRRGEKKKGECCSYVVGGAAGRLSKPIGRAQGGVELVAFVLRAVVLPVGRKRVREGACQLIDERGVWPQATEEGLGLAAPVDAPVLLA